MGFTRQIIRAAAKESGMEALPREFEDALVSAHVETRDRFAEEKAKPLLEELNTLKDGAAKFDAKESDEYKALMAEFDSYKADVQAKADNTAKTDLLRTALKAAGANEKFIDRMIKSADLSAVTVKDGALEKADDVVGGFKAGEWADVFGETVAKATPLGSPPNQNNSGVELDKMSMEDYIAARKKGGK